MPSSEDKKFNENLTKKTNMSLQSLWKGEQAFNKKKNTS
jgi:hypothetical protein